MMKHEGLLVVLALVVLKCTLSTHREGTGPTLQVKKKIPGLR